MSNPGPNITQTTNTAAINDPTDGAVIGGSATSLVGYYGATPVAQQNSIGTITDSSGGTAAATNGILTLTGTYNSTILANAIATLAAQINSIDAALVTYGLLKT